MGDTATKTRESVRQVLKEPSKYKVVFLNDDHTPMEFVIEVLMYIFHHDAKRSHELTMQVHEKGSAVVGVYTYEIAEQKGIETTALAKQAGYPLHVKVESE